MLGGAAAADLLVSPQHHAGADASSSPAPTYGPVTVAPTDQRFPELVTAFNRRWVASPGSVVMVGSAAQAQAAVQAAVNAGQLISVRGGGHCYANFVYNSKVQSIIDLTMLNKVYFDTGRNAFCIEGGALLGDVYPQLFRGYGVTLPGGHCPGTGIGGHATGGGHGMLSRQFGLITDLIVAVEMVVVDSTGTAQLIVAEKGGANADLWWAVAGGGGGNFGVITKYWFRSPSATGTAAGSQLPKPPKNWLVTNATIPWSSLTQTTFTTLVRNLGTFFAANSAPTSPYCKLSSILSLSHVSGGPISLVTLVDQGQPDASTATSGPQLLANYHNALFANTGLPTTLPFRTLPWGAVEETINTATPLIETNATFRNAVKSANLRKGLTDAQIATIWKQMNRADYSNPLPALLQLGAQAGGQVNALAKDATAVSYRSSCLLAFFQVYWTDASADATNLGWLRDLYSGVFSTTGGFPVYNDAYEGCVINLPDPDVLDPSINTTGVSWQSLYYDTNYPRLQQVKAKYDPKNFFTHPMGITAT